MYIMMVLVFVGFATIGSTVTAVGTGRKDYIKSKGVIDYANGTVVIDSSDLIYLADEIDDLESEYKKKTVAALNSIGTYFQIDGSVTYKKEEETLPAEFATNLSFQNIYEGLIQSQSVQHLESQQAKDDTGALLYYESEEAQKNYDLHSTTTTPNDYPVLIHPATPESLTAGTAAWVDGTLIIGNGVDNNAFYESGTEDSIKNIYDRVSYPKNYDDIKSAIDIASQNDALWTRRTDTDDDTYEIPLIDEEGRMLYAISLDSKYIAWQSPTGNTSSASGKFELNTKEGELLESFNASISNSSAINSYTTKNIYIDLFEKKFSTEDDKLYLKLHTSATGYYQTNAASGGARMIANFQFINITARYK